MDPFDTVDQHSTLEPPASAQGNDQVTVSDQAGSFLEDEAAVISPLLEDMIAYIDEDEPMESDVVVPAETMADLLIAGDSIPPSALPMPGESATTASQPHYVAPKTEPPLDSNPHRSGFSLDASGAVAPSREHIGAVAPQHELSGANAPRSDEVQPPPSRFKSGGFERFSYASVVARQQAAAAAESAAAGPSRPLPATPGRRANRKRPAPHLTVAQRGPLPDFTLETPAHHLVGSHPWAQLVSLRTEPFPSNPDFVTAAMPLELYDHIPKGGYLSAKYVRRLFPMKFKEKPSRRQRLSVIELMRLEHAVAFRRSSQCVIDDLLEGRYVVTENSRPVTPEGTMPSVVYPETRDLFPVLYQVVNKGVGQGVVLEAKDFFVPGPGRRELHLITLDQFATNVSTNTRGFDRALVSVKDLVWVYSVEPTRAALRDPPLTLKQARIPKATALDQRFPYFFRVKEFVFVTPPSTTQRTLGIVLSLVVRYETVKGLRIAFEGAPEAVPVSPKMCDFPLEQVEHDEIVAAHVRPNVPCTMRFSESPVSRDAQSTLCSFVMDFLPAHPEEGMLPLRVFKLTTEEKRWIADRAGSFTSYNDNPRAAQRQMAHLFNAACSALAAVNCLNDDKRTHLLTAIIPSMSAFPLRFDFTIGDMSSECGWTTQRPVYLWVVGSRSIIRALIEQADHSYEDRSIAVRLVVPGWAHRSAHRTVSRFATTLDDITKVEICVRLGDQPAGTDPLYELISQRQLFARFDSDSHAAAILDAVYGFRRTRVGPVGPQPENVIASVNGRTLQLRPDQVTALRMGEQQLPILAIQAAYGTGKTVVGALIAARLCDSLKQGVIAATTTNNAVAQFTDTLLRLDDYKHLPILRYVSDTALVDGAPQTPIDLHTVLKRLSIDYASDLSDSALDICVRYKRGRELLERLMFDRDLAIDMSEAERDEYRLAERDISKLTQDMIDIMFRVRPPAVLCITTSALHNSVAADGIFHGKLGKFTTIIGDEASQIPEPALIALATHLSQARHIYIGDIHQLEPHARCPRNSNPARFGAQGIMNVLVARGVPVAPLTTTFRAHPLLNDLPNRLFYNRVLISGTRADDRQMFLSVVRCPNPKLPFLFVDVQGSSTKALSGSHCNMAEAEVCRQIVLALTRKHVSPSSIAIVAFYKEQLRVLAQFANNLNVDLHTVDSVQGREKDIVILLPTRTGFDTDRGEFLDEPHRLNVALTRCRHGQFVLGHEQSLRGLSYWNNILTWAHNHSAVSSASALPDLID